MNLDSTTEVSTNFEKIDTIVPDQVKNVSHDST